MKPTEARDFMNGTFGPAMARSVITKLADQVEALTKERDEYRTKYNECYEVLNDLIKERDALMQASKLALDALSVSYPTVRSRLRAHNEAIETLKKAGVL